LIRTAVRAAGAHVQAFAKGASARFKRDLNARMEVQMKTLSPPARTTDRDEAIAWLRILWTVPISNEDLTGFFRWSRQKPKARALYDDLSRRLFDKMMAEPAKEPGSP
jgi:hypothetical protein